MKEFEKLEEISRNIGYSRGVMNSSVRYGFEVFRRHLKGPLVLELGPAEGVMTELLLGQGYNITAVEGSKYFADDLVTRFPEAEVIHTLFETFTPSKAFDTIVLGHVLEHVADPVELLSRIKTWLSPNGRVLCSVPNSNSIHRQAAVLMGLLTSENSLNESDIQHGHRRVFSSETLKSTFLQAGLTIEQFGGYWLKPLSNAQIEENWTEKMVDAFMVLGEKYPENAAEIYLVAH